jgi:uncharacterized protein YgiM (DUF1202 family)
MITKKLIIIALLTLLSANVTFAQYQIDFEPIKPFPLEFDAPKGMGKFEFVNGKAEFVNESEDEYNARNEEFKKELRQAYLNSDEYKTWLKLHIKWRKRNPNWRKLTNYKELLSQSKKPVPQFPTGKIGDDYLVTSNTLNLRSEPNSASEIITELVKGSSCKLLSLSDDGWWLVKTEDEIQGYVSSKLLKRDPYSGWIKKKLESGESPDCDNYDKQYGDNIDNYLRINVGSHTNVVVKLMQRRPDGDICIRFIFVPKNGTSELKNIPEGDYYLKIAYGSDWRQKVIDGKCVGKFMEDAHYEIGKERLSYNIIHQIDKDQIPSYELTLDMITVRAKNKEFNVNSISQDEFNK